MIPVRGFLTVEELAPYVQKAKSCAFDLDDGGIELVLIEVAAMRADRAVKAYAELSRAALMKLASENKRLREQLGRKRKTREPARGAEVIPLSAAKAAVR